MAGHVFMHQQLRSCTLGMWLLSQLPVFCPLLPGVGMGLEYHPVLLSIIWHNLTTMCLCVVQRSHNSSDAQEFNRVLWLPRGAWLVCQQGWPGREERNHWIPSPHTFLVLFTCSDQLTHPSFSFLIHPLISIYTISIYPIIPSHFDIHALPSALAFCSQPWTPHFL